MSEGMLDHNQISDHEKLNNFDNSLWKSKNYCMNFITKLFRIKPDGGDDNIVIREIDEPVLSITSKNEYNDNTQRFEYCVVIEKPNCCYICKELLCESDLKLDSDPDHDPAQDPDVKIGNVADLADLCNNWKTWDIPMASQIKLIYQNMENGVTTKQLRRYCKLCVAKTLVTQVEDQRQLVYSLASDSRSKKVALKCLFCHDCVVIKHSIYFKDAVKFLDDNQKEQFTTAYNRIIDEHDIRNKHCPIPNCRFYAKTTTFIECPDHGQFCTNCFEKANPEAHRCRGVPRELRDFDFLRRCPKCTSLVEKNGGCTHMKCPCGHEFYWDKLKPIEIRKKIMRRKTKESKEQK